MTLATGIGWFTIAVCAVGLAFSLAIYFLRPDRRQNWYVAIMIAAAALGWVGDRGFRYFSSDYDVMFAWRLTGHVLWGFALAFYVLLLATLDSPLSAWLRRPAGAALGVAACVSWSVAALVAPQGFVTGSTEVDAALWGLERLLVTGPLTTGWELFALAVWVYAVAVSVSAWRRAKTPIQRKQIGAYVLAFVIHDVVLFCWVAINAFTKTSSPPLVVASLVGPALASLALYLLLSYGILRAQLFDIDLRLKLGLRRGVVAGAFLFAFFATSEIAQNWFSDRMGWLAGGLVAGALLFGLAPLQRAAERVAHAAMPEVVSTDEYLAFRKVEVYKGALEEMLGDGVLTERDRLILAGIRRRLGLAEASALAIERDVMAMADEMSPLRKQASA